jgi:RES domain-containing protein
VTALWRISNHCDLSGVGGERSDGRWHTAARGKRIVYLSEHPALALIETLVNLKGDPRRFPEKYQLLELSVENRLIEHVPIADLRGAPPDSRGPIESTRRIGDDWLAGQSSVLLKVPSIPCPFSWNFLFNPIHPDAAAATKIESCNWIEYDKRLFRIRSSSP